MRESVRELIGAQAVVPVLRSAGVEDAIETARAAAGAGMSVVELTCSTPGVEEAIAVLAGEGMTVGLGTVTDPGAAEAAAAAGARFLVSFAAPVWLLDCAAGLGIDAIPGTFTPSEVLAARDAGAELVKLFPARALGPAYLRDLRTVMPGLAAIATGGIALADGSIGGWLTAGAVAVGLGSDLGSVATIGSSGVAERAREALAQAQAASG
ncbi:MAG TPA: bifunctional 4-hydroxy-2-oxoglutarate aldolase/2-dehydro-3-deoxy-phosphogluconate aldolase [Solirubrobacterales bacterium]|nr:bifunctional 4-hydroxy-2-oxoglutarate aldolase/2-dehydro-3-deoxy-phosphogluconate aldolase [Solirubrobacterales bacterium]